MSYLRGLSIVKKELVKSIKEKEIQMAKLEAHIEKSSICSDLYNKVVLEKAILKKELEKCSKKGVILEFKKIFPRKKKLICDYFKSGKAVE